ncbi:FMRFamide receptor-like [Aplysia californica]|uniref:FMRFamide receptor-like n=1 Tax=Aplysia californica TaxID=6500 RepID=A0ABM0JR27_APLCA|nr:FMRFamide receptor-like [Aplysia californica]
MLDVMEKFLVSNFNSSDRLESPPGSAGMCMSLDTNLTSSELPSLLSYETRMFFVIINFMVLCPLVAIFGIFTNIINIVVFTKQGFTETINISLLCLAISDLCGLLPLPWMGIALNPWFSQTDLPFSVTEMLSPTAGFPHNCFSRITGWITALVALERSLCIAFPLKVKIFMTRTVVICVNVTIFVCMILGILPLYATAYYDWKFYPEKNKTLLGILYTENKDEVQSISLIFTDLIGPLSAFTVVLVSMVVIRIKLVQKVKWRQTASASSSAMSKGKQLPAKENRVVAMVTIISVIFIICFTPMSLFLTVRAFMPELSVIGRYANMNWAFLSTAFLMESINSSTNIFIYYNMSSKFKDTFQGIFFKRGHKQARRRNVLR